MVEHGYNERLKRRELYTKRMEKKRIEEMKRRRMSMLQEDQAAQTETEEEEEEYYVEEPTSSSPSSNSPVAQASMGISRDRLYNLMKRLEVRSPEIGR